MKHIKTCGHDCYSFGRAVLQPWPVYTAMQSATRPGLSSVTPGWSSPLHPNSVFARTICPVHPVCCPIVAASPVWEPLSHRRSGLPFFLCPCLVIPDKIRVEMITFAVPWQCPCTFSSLAFTHLYLILIHYCYLLLLHYYIIVLPIIIIKIGHPKNRIHCATITSILELYSKLQTRQTDSVSYQLW